MTKNNQYLKKVSKIQMEISSLCNALCLGCVRTDTRNFSRPTPNLPKKAIMSLDTFEKIISDPYFKNTPENTIQFCGTVDDPLMHPQWLEILELCVKHKVSRVDIHTNAGVRSPDEWREMRKLLKQLKNLHDPGYESLIRFNIDGLKDTNHLYRQRVKWEKVMENATAFLEDDGGKYARWQMIEFPWNSHQIEEAKQLAHDMGFEVFTVRHNRSNIIRDGTTLEEITKLQKKFNEKRSDDLDIQNTENTKVPDRIYDQLLNPDEEIDCSFQKEQMIFIDYNSRVWPCCFLRNLDFNHYAKHTEIMANQVDAMMFKKYNDSNDSKQSWNYADKHTLTEIMTHPFFANGLVQSFSDPMPTKQDLETGNTCDQKLIKCSKTCGKQSRKEVPLQEAHKKTKLWKYHAGKSREDIFLNSDRN